MTARLPAPTAQQQQTISSFIRAGAFPHVAAAAAGATPDQFDDWLRRGASPRGAKIYRDFAAAIRQATAEARIKAEIEAFKDRPLDWLRSGPGKENAANPGWTGNVKPLPKAAATNELTFDHPIIQQFLQLILHHLEPWPEARTAVANAVEAARATTDGESGCA